MIAEYLILNNTAIVVPCDKCIYFKKCRAVFRCNHPWGLKSPSVDSFCSYGKPKEVAYEDEAD
jgi:hypothetical protein